MRSALKRTRSRIAARISHSPHPLYLNLGSGPRGIASPHWINVDGFPDKNVQYLVDLSRPLPIPDGSFAGVFSEHVQEHFSLEDGIALIRECHRILAPGGHLRLIMPDGEKLMRTYFDDPRSLLARRPAPSGQPMESINNYFRQRYEHQCLYDFALAKFALETSGFTGVTQSSYGEGVCPKEMILDDSKYAWESLYVDAVKP
jgi:predicted SAM-dependent methyltransferase